MKKTVVVLMCVMVFLVVALANAGEDTSKSKTEIGRSGGESGKRWEYKVVSLSFSSSKNQKILNEEGANGWELVTVTSGKDKDYLDAYFKR